MPSSFTPSPTHPLTPSPDVSEGDINLSPSRARYVEQLPPATRDLLARDAAAYLHQSLSSPCLNALAAARGSTLTDLGGREILDFHGNSVHQLGHGHPRVVEAIKRQLDTLPFCPRRYTNEPAVELAERLAALTGNQLTRVLLAPGGGLAMGIAMKLARLATGRFKFLSMWGAFHGAGLDTISIGGEAVFRENLGPLLPGCEHVLPCVPSRCGCTEANPACARAIEEIMDHEPDLAALIVEPIRCTTVEAPPAAYYRRLREACSRRGVLLVFDEIPTALGRTGRMFAYEHFGITPDILVLGKGLGGGVFPQAAILAKESLNVGQATALGHYTHEKSPLGAAAALATLDVLRDDKLIERAETLGASWRSALRDALAPTGLLAHVRGFGLLVGVELAHPDGVRATAALADRVLYAAIDRGLSFKVSDGRVLTLTPPLTVTERELDRASEILLGSVQSAHHGL